MPQGFAGRKANQAYTAFHGKGVFGKDAEIRTHQALSMDAYKWSNKVTDAKLLECPKWDRAREFVLFL